jgi:hypothetical protein
LMIMFVRLKNILRLFIPLNLNHQEIGVLKSLCMEKAKFNLLV